MRKTISLVLAVLMMLVLLPAVKLSPAVAEEATFTYKLVTSKSELTDGSYLIVEKANGFVFSGASGDYHNYVAATVADGTITGNFIANEITIAAVTDGYTMLPLRSTPSISTKTAPLP